VLDYAAARVLLDRESLDRHGAATLATWLMTPFIQRAAPRHPGHHAKLDELLKASHEVVDEVTRVDDKEPEEFREGQRRRDVRGERTSGPLCLPADRRLGACDGRGRAKPGVRRLFSTRRRVAVAP
jgi:hypothetical protein